MKKYLLLISLSIVCIQDVSATHTKGGWMYYEYLGPGLIDPAKLRYKIGLNLYINCASTLIEPTWNFSFFNGAAPYAFIQDITVNAAPDYSISGCTLASCYPCLSTVPDRCYKIINYETIVELAPTPDGYIISKQRCCRIAGISNLVPPTDNLGATFTIKIPGTSSGFNAPQNTSPKFIFNDTAVVCGDNPFVMNFTATDADADSLAYSFTGAYTGADATNSNPGTAAAPPYATVPYQPPYSGVQPLGSAVTIDPVTGVISGTAPPPGEYVVCVLVKEYRNGAYIAESRKELHLKVAFCTPLHADPNFTPITCDGFTVNFTDNSSGNPTTHLWNFGDPASGINNTSNLPNPTHTFTAAGIFNVKLVVSLAGQCIDSITKPLGVFPGFFPGFITSAPLCIGQPVQFTDTTKTNYGVVDSWRWDFGDPATLGDTSHIATPVYTYNPAGTYTVQLIVTNSKGCQKTINVPININDVPLINVFPRDSGYCGLDTLQLTGTGTGNFNWTPNYNIIGANTATPMVYPATTTRYYAQLTNAVGCKNYDSLDVRPKFDLANFIAGPTIICEEDTVTLTGTSNYFNNIAWQWGPPGTIESPNNDITRVYPITTTTYMLTTRWGNNCVVSKTHTINVIPLAHPNAGPDTYVCPGNQNSVQLNASGGNTYSWTPTTGLSNPNIANPIASPLVPTTYTVAVGVTGCSKTRTDDVFVNVGLPPALTVMNDTLICDIDTLQVTTTGVGTYTWTPNYMISSLTSPNPFVSPNVPTMYHVRITDPVGCHTDDSIFVDVKIKVTIKAGPDTSMCGTDTIRLNLSSDALSFIWSPSTYLNSTTAMHPMTTPLTSITYYCIGNIGKCQNIDSVHIKVGQYPIANAGPDETICPGFSTQLHATGGSSYLWSPVTFLNNRSIPDPTCSSPFGNIRYVVTVSDTFGCPKAVRDTVWVMLYPKAVVDAGPSDTIVVEGEPLLLNAIGNGTYVWSPSLWLNYNNIANPISLPHGDISYQVVCTSPNGCLAKDIIKIKWFNVDPDIYVPTAWAPNGKNRELAPILRGMKQLNYFRIFNRFGEMVFETTQEGVGWDGNYKGRAQDVATFVWYAEGITYKGQVKKKKGYAVLIR